MGTLHIDEIKAGSQLGEDVFSPQGMKIASQGDTISERHLKAFKAWGVMEIEILGETAPDTTPKAELPDDTSCQADIEMIDRLFAKTDRNDAVIAALYDLAVKKATAA